MRDSSSMRLGQTFPRESHADAPSPERDATYPDPGGRADRRLRPLPRQGDGRRPRRRLRDRLQGRPRHARRARCACAAPASGGSPRCRCCRSATTATAVASPSTGRVDGSSPSRRGPTASRLAGRAAPQGRRRPVGSRRRARRRRGSARPRVADRRRRARRRRRRPARRDDLAGVRGRRRPRARAVRRLVRAVPALVRRASAA